MAISLADVAAAAPASLPTYRTAADVLEGQTGSGWRLASWTVLRTALIAPPFLLVGVPAKKAWGGAAIASVAISCLTLFRIFKGGQEIAGAQAAAHFRSR